MHSLLSSLKTILNCCPPHKLPALIWEYVQKIKGTSHIELISKIKSSELQVANFTQIRSTSASLNCFATEVAVFISLTNSLAETISNSFKEFNNKYEASKIAGAFSELSSKG